MLSTSSISMIHTQTNVSRTTIFNMRMTAFNDGVVVEESQGPGLSQEGIFVTAVNCGVNVKESRCPS